MIDFSKKDLYKQKKKDMDKFLTNILITESQRDEYEEIDDSDDGSLDDFLSGDFEEFDDDDFGGGFGDTFDPFGGLDEFDKGNEGEEEGDKPYNTDNAALNILVSPYYLFYYMFKSLSENKRLRNKDDIISFLNNQTKVSSVVLGITLFLLIFTNAAFIFSLTIQTLIAVLMVVGSIVGVRVIENKNYFDDETDDVIDDEMEDGIGGIGEGIELNSNINEDDFNGDLEDDFSIDMDSPKGSSSFEADDFDFGIEEDFGLDDFDFGDDDLDFGDDYDDFDESFELSDDDILNLPEEDFTAEETVDEEGSPIPHSIVDVQSSDEKFYGDLEKVYNINEKYRGVEIHDRVELVKSLSGYLLANDKGFGSWDTVVENSIVYNNIMYTIYLGLIEIQHAFKDISDNQNKMIINSCIENPLMYRVEFEVPKKYFRNLANHKEVFESKLKVSDSDKEVLVMVSSYREGFVLKIVKPVRGLVSLGDILRYHNDQIAGDQVYEQYLNEKNALPLVLGLRDVEYPEIVDLADNTSVVIAGESGSGKSWGTFLVMMNLIFTNDYNDMNVVVMDRKKSVFWREFGRFPHVIGYHTDVPEYFDLLKELLDEMEYRKEILGKAGLENWKSLRSGLIKAGKYDQVKAFPWLVIVIDEVSNTMKEIKTGADGDDKLKEFEDYLTMLTQEGRSLGIKVVLIGQRTIAAAMPKNPMENSSLKFAFKLSEPDMQKVVDLPRGMKTPQVVGQAILQDADMSSPVLLRTLTVGGVNDDQIVNVIRILSFEWNRRSDGNILTRPRGMSLLYNRDVIREKVFEDMERGRLFISEGSTDLSMLAEALIQGESISHITEDDLYIESDKKEDENISLDKPDDGNDFDEEGFSFDDFKYNGEDSEDNDSDESNLDDFNDDFDDDFGLDDFGDDFEDESFGDDDFGIEDDDDFDFDFDFDFDIEDESLTETEESYTEALAVKKEDKLGIRDYIIKNGKGNSFKYIDKSIIEDNYDTKEIRRALLKSEITEDDSYYRI